MQAPQMLTRQRETIKYQPRVSAVRICPTHNLPLDDDGVCAGAHSPDYWEVRCVWPDGTLTEPLYRASWDDGPQADRTVGISHKPAPRNRIGFNPARKSQYLAETRYHLRQTGHSPEEAKRIAEERWARNIALWELEQRELRRQ